MTKDDVSKLINNALKLVASESPQLPLDKNIGERALVGRIAQHLDHLLKGIDEELKSDIEYNIDPYGDRKWLDAFPALEAAAKKVRRKIYEDESIVVIPDIVIHKRGTNDKNRVVIEVKLSKSSIDEQQYARMKLKAFQQKPFKYKFGIFLSINRSWEKFAESAVIEFIPAS